MPEKTQQPDAARARVTVISGGTDGMGRALALARARRGDRVVAIGSNADKGRALLTDADSGGLTGRVEFLRADLTSVADTRRVIGEIGALHPVVDVLALFANRQAPHRVITPEGFESTFALYYLSRYVLSHELAPLLGRSVAPVIVNVAGVGSTKGSIHWDDLQLAAGYSTIAAQLQAGRANDLLGVAYAAQSANPMRYVLYHPGFTRSGDLSVLAAPTRAFIRAAAAVAAHSIERSIGPIHEFIETPPTDALTVIDRGKGVPLTLKTLNPADAERLAASTRRLLADLAAHPSI